jgi:hypothetical protein
LYQAIDYNNYAEPSADEDLPEGYDIDVYSSSEGVQLQSFSNNPNDPWFTTGTTHWDLKGYPGARCSDAWKVMDTSSGYSTRSPIAVIDTGLPAVLPTDVDPNMLVEKKDLVNNDLNVRMPSGVSTTDLRHHGMWVASQIVAYTNNSQKMTAASWANRVYFYKVAPDNSYIMPSWAITAAIMEAVKDGAKVINLSLGYSGTSIGSALKAAIDSAIAAGVTVVAAAGNDAENGNPLHFPAAYGPVISVGASTGTGVRASFSTHNSAVDVAAPGSGIPVLSSSSTTPAFADGTSFAAPLVAAAAAMLKRENMALTPSQIDWILKTTTHNYPSRSNGLGYGIIDARQAVELSKLDNCVYDPNLKPGSRGQITLSPDMTGDGYGEIVSTDNRNRLLVNPSSSTGAIGQPYQLGKGFSSMTVYAPGDWNGDGRPDIIARDSAGKLFLYPKRANMCLSSSTEIGHGWSGFRVTPVGDMTGDGYGDIYAVQESTGKLFLYAGNGTGGFKGSPYPQEVGHGWSTVKLHSGRDINRDGKNDIFGITSDGTLKFYPGTGTGTVGTGVQAGTGWNSVYVASGADLNGDGPGDLVGRVNSSNNLLLYRGKSTGGVYSSVQIGTGW